jgi:hypothetical protein
MFPKFLILILIANVTEYEARVFVPDDIDEPRIIRKHPDFSAVLNAKFIHFGDICE